MEHRISIAVVTRNRPESLRRTLASLSRQSMKPFEVVVSDDSSVDGEQTKAIAEEFGCRYVEGPQKGLYANRNSAIRHCRGTHVRSMDDDHEFPEGHLEACQRAVIEDANCVWTIGEYLPTQAPRPSPPHTVPSHMHPRGFCVDPDDPDDSWAISDGASIYPIRIFEEGHLFSEAFVFGAAYLEFGSRIHSAGWRIRHLPTTYVIHHFDERARSYSDEKVNLGSRLFATFSHSFVHQRSLSNMALTLFQFGLEFARRPRMTLGCVGTAFHACREMRRQLHATRRQTI